MTKSGWNAEGLAFPRAGLLRRLRYANFRKLAGFALTLGLVCAVSVPVVAGAPPAPVAVGPTITAGTIMPAGALFTVGDAGGSAATSEIEITDPAGGGAFSLNGAQYDGVTFTVPVASLADLVFTAGGAGTETITARVTDGAGWSAPAQAAVTTTAGSPGVVVDLVAGRVFIPGQGWLSATNFMEYYYANAAQFADPGYVEGLGGLRAFVQ